MPSISDWIICIPAFIRRGNCFVSCATSCFIKVKTASRILGSACKIPSTSFSTISTPVSTIFGSASIIAVRSLSSNSTIDVKISGSASVIPSTTAITNSTAASKMSGSDLVIISIRRETISPTTSKSAGIISFTDSMSERKTSVTPSSNLGSFDNRPSRIASAIFPASLSSSGIALAIASIIPLRTSTAQSIRGSTYDRTFSTSFGKMPEM